MSYFYSTVKNNEFMKKIVADNSSFFLQEFC